MDATPHNLTAHQRAVLDQPWGRTWLEGPAGAGKTTAALAHLFRLLNQGVSGDSILVFTPQRALAIPYERALRQPATPPTGQVALLTLGGLARRMVDLFWLLVSAPGGFAFPAEPPVFLTLETAQYYMARLARPLLEERRLFDSVSLDRNRLYSQVLDNLNKAAVVGYPIGEIGERLKRAWIGEPGQLRIYDDVQTCAEAFRAFCLQHNLLDFSLQVELFRARLWRLPECRELLRSAYRHLIYDNIEEDPPVAHDLLLEWLPDFDSALLVYDWAAGFRRFLGADPQSACRFKPACERRLTLAESLAQSAPIHTLEQRLDQALRLPGEGHFLFEEPCASAEAQTTRSADEADSADPREFLPEFVFGRFYPDMLDGVAQTIFGLVEQGVPPGEIVALAPYLSDALRFALVERLAAFGIPARSHRPSRALREEPATECLLTLAALAHPHWGIRPSKFDVAYALIQAIEDLDLVRAQLLTEIVFRPKSDGAWLTSFDRIRPETQERITYRLGERYEKLRLWLADRPADEAELDHFLSRLFGEALSQPGFGFHARYDAGQMAANLIESVRKFRQTAGPVLEEQGVPLGKEYLLMVREGVIAAQYLSGWRLAAEEAVLLAPAYTFLMANRPVEVQFWLDTGSRAWMERLYQPLTHPFVLSRGWSADAPWTDSDEYASGRESLRRLAMGLLRRCRSRLYLGLSELNEQGYEQRGPLLAAFQRLLRESGV